MSGTKIDRIPGNIKNELIFFSVLDKEIHSVNSFLIVYILFRGILTVQNKNGQGFTSHSFESKGLPFTYLIK